MTENEAMEVLANHFVFLRESWKPYPDGKVLDAIRISISTMKEIQQYRAIGTVEECRDARERQRAKKIIVSHNGAVEDRGKAFCPNCRMDIHGVGMIGACFRCGQRLKWNDTP